MGQVTLHFPLTYIVFFFTIMYAYFYFYHHVFVVVLCIIAIQIDFPQCCLVSVSTASSWYFFKINHFWINQNTKNVKISTKVVLTSACLAKKIVHLLFNIHQE